MQNSKAKKVVSIVLNALVWAFLVFAILVTITTFATKNTKDGVPELFGKSIVSIQSDSMKSSKKESFKKGDLIIIEKITPEQAMSLEIGAIITYRAPVDIDKDGKTGDINTHRIVDKKTDAGIVYYITQGDNVNVEDPYELRFTDVIGVYHGTKLVGVGGILDFLRSSVGFFLVIVLPMALFFIYEVYNLIKIVMAHKIKVAKEGAISAEQEEEIKRLAIEEYLASQKAQAQENSNNTEE